MKASDHFIKRENEDDYLISSPGIILLLLGTSPDDENNKIRKLKNEMAKTLLKRGYFVNRMAAKQFMKTAAAHPQKVIAFVKDIWDKGFWDNDDTIELMGLVGKVIRSEKLKGE